jgi:hypothetical protein
MRRTPVVTVLLAAAALVLPAPASAEEQTLAFTVGPVAVDGYAVTQQVLAAPAPTVDGYVTGMSAEIVDAAGNVTGRRDVMLHHVVFARIGTPDFTCGGAGERFYAAGEERQTMDLPAGYGYPHAATDRWFLLAMLMNHRPRRLEGFVRYTVRYVAGEELVPVRPVWLDVRNCTGPDPVFDVPGTGTRSSRFTQTWDYRMPESGRIVAGGGHLHGGGIELSLQNQTCGASLFTSLPTWGGPVPRPILHHPGPTRMSQFSSGEGIPVSAGDTLRLSAVYDNSRPYTRAMGIMLVYFASGAVAPCQPTPPLATDGAPTVPPPFRMPLPRAPAGKLAANLRSTWVGDFRYGHERVSLRRGSTFTWRFIGRVPHDVTLVNGPVGFSSPWTLNGTYRHRFARRGTYELFCSLHPTRMTQKILVR